MAEQVVSARPDDVLVSLGLGSCIGLALVDEGAGVAGLSHIVLPASPGPVEGPARAKFADTAVASLVDAVTKAGGRSTKLRAVLAGGASMFGAKGGTSALMQIGQRNAERTLQELVARRITVRAQDTGGSTGRSIEVRVQTGEVLVRGVGRPAKVL